LQIFYRKSFLLSRKAQGIVILGLLTLIWGSSFILIKEGLRSLSFWQLGSLRIVIAGLIMMIFVAFQWREVQFSDLKKAAISGLLGNFFPSFLFGLAVSGVSSSVAGILNTLTPVWVLLTSCFFWGFRRVKTGQVIGVVIGFLGAMLLIIQSQGSEISLNYYGLYAVLGTFCYGLNINYIKKNLSHISSLTLSSLCLSIVFWPALILMIFNDIPSIFQLENAKSLFAVFLLAVFSTALGLVLFNKLIKMVSPVLASTVTYLMPIVSVFWGVYDGEALRFLDLLGVCFVFLGIFAIARLK
jgi:drug/metabolite transporter (DMT)-like permease